MGRRKASPGSARQNTRLSFAEVAPAVSTILLGSKVTLFPLISDMKSTNACIIVFKEELDIQIIEMTKKVGFSLTFLNAGSP